MKLPTLTALFVSTSGRPGAGSLPDHRLPGPVRGETAEGDSAAIAAAARARLPAHRRRLTG